MDLGIKNENIIKSLKKISLGYEYEEIQTIVHETEKGIDKKVTRNKKHYPPNFQAIQYVINHNIKKGSGSLDEEMLRLQDDLNKLMEDKSQWKL